MQTSYDSISSINYYIRKHRIAHAENWKELSYVNAEPQVLWTFHRLTLLHVSYIRTL